jgi:hypothetical protein
MAQETKFSFSLSNIETVQFATFEENLHDNNPVQQTVSLDIGYNIQFQSLIILTKVSFEQNSLPFLVLESSCEYKISDVTWISLKREDGSYIIKRKNILQLILVSMLTMRGILHAKTENTPLNKYFLQSFNMTALHNEDYVIPLEPGR